MFSFYVTAFSFKIDGSDDKGEWENSQAVALFVKEESNCKIRFGSYKWNIEDGSLYICFNFYETDFDHLNSNIGISFSVDGSQYYTLLSEESQIFDSDKHRIETAMKYDGAYGAVCEARVGFKYGIPENINGKVRFIDTEGAYSNVYYFSISNPSYTYDYPEYQTEKPPKTTKPTETKPTTTVLQTTTQKEKTTKPKTTESDGSIWDFLDVFIETTTKKPGKTTTSKPEKTTKVKVVTSVVIVEKVKPVKQSETITETAADVKTTAETIAETTANETIIESTSDGKKYQIITAVAGGITLITVAVLGTYGANKKAENKSSDDNE